MPATTRKVRKQERQQQDILDSARNLLLREGVDRFTMRKLATEVGCAPGTIYLYFEDKDHLIAALVEDSFERLMVDLERRRDLGPLEFLENLMHAYIKFGLSNPHHYYFAFMLRRTPALDKVRPRPHRSYALLCDTLEACVNAGVITPVDVKLAAPAVWASLHGLTSLMITMPNFPWGSKKKVVNQHVAAVLQGLGSTGGRKDEES